MTLSRGNNKDHDVSVDANRHKVVSCRPFYTVKQT